MAFTQAPFVWTRPEHLKKAWRAFRLQQILFPLFVLLLGLAASAIATWQFAELSAERDAERRNQLIQVRLDSIADALSRHRAALRGVAGLFASSDVVTAGMFNSFVRRQDMARTLPGVQGLGFAEVKNRDSGELKTAIAYLYPQDARNTLALGYDMFGEPTRRAAMERARDTGRAALSGRVRLRQEDAGGTEQPGFLVYAPVYQGRGEFPQAVDERRRALRGWVFSPFRADDFFRQGVLNGAAPKLLHFAVYDGPQANPETLLFNSGIDPQKAQRRTLSVAGHEWTILLSTTRAFERQSSAALAPFVFLGGAVATLLIAVTTAAQTRSAIREQSERARAERVAAQQEAILSQLAEGVIVTDAMGKITFVNDAAARIHGVARLDVEPDDYSNAYQLFTESGEPHPPETLPLARAVLRHETVRDERWRIRRPDGREVLAIGSAQPIRGRAGDVWGAVLTLRDDTDRAAGERALRTWSESLEERVMARTAELREARDRLAKINRHLEDMVAARVADLAAANEEIQRFAYIVSHDLRSPLVNIMGFTSELERVRGALSSRLSDDQRDAELIQDFGESLEFIQAAIEKMDGLIKAILKVSREGRRVMVPEPIDMNALVDGLVLSLAHQAAEAGALIERGDLPEVESDRLAVEQIFANLVDNALKYLDPARPGKISVSGRADGSVRIFEVSDNGRGIAPRDHARVFELFRRAGPQNRPGEGLGLAYVKMLVRTLGGRIQLRSELGEGSTFTVTLPAKPIPAATTSEET